MAFFPCIYFETIQMYVFSLNHNNDRKRTLCEKIDVAMERLEKRTSYHKILYKLLAVITERGLRMVLENPATTPNYLISGQNFPTPTFIDKDRMMRGDVYKKPTAYWFFGCEPTNGFTEQRDKEQKTIMGSKPSPKAGICSEERSMISPDYARNFIHDFILGKPQINTQLCLFQP